MALECRIHNKVAVISFNHSEPRQIDFADVETRVSSVIHKDGILQFVIDMEPVGRLASAQLGAIISVYRLIQTRGGTLLFTNISDRLSEILDKTRLTDLFETFDSIEQALDHLETSQPKSINEER